MKMSSDNDKQAAFKLNLEQEKIDKAMAKMAELRLKSGMTSAHNSGSKSNKYMNSGGKGAQPSANAFIKPVNLSHTVFQNDNM